MKSPAFSFYVRDWLCSKTVSKLHSKAYSKDGSNPLSRCLNAYLFLLCESWLEDGFPALPDNDEDLAAMARVTPEEWKHIKPLLMPKFHKDTKGNLFNERLFDEWEKQQRRKQSGSKGGSKTAANRVANHAAALEDEIEDGTDPDRKGGEGGNLLSVEEAIKATMTVGIPEDFCRHVYEDWSSREGRDGAGVLVPWLRYVTKRWSRERGMWNNGTHKGKNQTGNGHPNIPTHDDPPLEEIRRREHEELQRERVKAGMLREPFVFKG